MRSRLVLCAVLLSALAATAAAQKQRADNWASFRGEHAAGVAQGENLPETWDAQKGANVKWKTPIPGLAHSSPVVWGNRVFVTEWNSSALVKAATKSGKKNNR